MKNRRSIFAMAMLVMLFVARPHTSSGQAPAAPSFSCAHVTSQVSSLICSTPRLAQLDQELALVFNNMQGQPLDHKRLRADEDAWIAALHHDCSDVACIEDRYKSRLQVLRDQSLLAASPATYYETRPFTVSEPLQAQAAGVIGKPCSTQGGLVDAEVKGFRPAPRFQPILGQGFVVVVRQAGERTFAFLLSAGSDKESCFVHDGVALPSDVAAGRFLQCSNQDPPLTGFGVRGASPGSLAAFWTVETNKLRFDRVAIKVLGVDRSVRCHQPEMAE